LRRSHSSVHLPQCLILSRHDCARGCARAGRMIVPWRAGLYQSTPRASSIHDNNGRDGYRTVSAPITSALSCAGLTRIRPTPARRTNGSPGRSFGERTDVQTFHDDNEESVFGGHEQYSPRPPPPYGSRLARRIGLDLATVNEQDADVGSRDRNASISRWCGSSSQFAGQRPVGYYRQTAFSSSNSARSGTSSPDSEVMRRPARSSSILPMAHPFRTGSRPPRHQARRKRHGP